jgi:hypothetical protein
MTRIVMILRSAASPIIPKDISTGARKNHFKPSEFMTHPAGPLNAENSPYQRTAQCMEQGKNWYMKAAPVIEALRTCPKVWSSDVRDRGGW